MDKKTIAEFTRGVLDRIRDHSRRLDPVGWREADAIETEITERTLRNGDRASYVRKVKRGL